MTGRALLYASAREQRATNISTQAFNFPTVFHSFPPVLNCFKLKVLKNNKQQQCRITSRQLKLFKVRTPFKNLTRLTETFLCITFASFINRTLHVYVQKREREARFNRK